MRLPQFARRGFLCNASCGYGCLAYRQKEPRDQRDLFPFLFLFATNLLLNGKRHSQDVCGDEQRTVWGYEDPETPSFLPQAAAKPTSSPAAGNHRNCA